MKKIICLLVLLSLALAACTPNQTWTWSEGELAACSAIPPGQMSALDRLILATGGKTACPPELYRQPGFAG